MNVWTEGLPPENVRVLVTVERNNKSLVSTAEYYTKSEIPILNNSWLVDRVGVIPKDGLLHESGDIERVTAWRKLPKYTDSHWIKDRLPNNGFYKLINFDGFNNPFKNITVGFYDYLGKQAEWFVHRAIPCYISPEGIKKYNGKRLTSEYKVIGWMELPQPYGG